MIIYDIIYILETIYWTFPLMFWVQDMTDQANCIKSLERKIEQLKGQNICLELDKDGLMRTEYNLRDDIEHFTHYLHVAKEQHENTNEELKASREAIIELVNLQYHSVGKIQTLRHQIDHFMHQHTQYRE